MATLAASASLAEETQVPRITVFGTATTEVVPDQMVWSLKVETKGPVLETLAGEHMKIVQAALEFLRKSKVDEKTTQSSRMEFGENWVYKSNSQVREGYVASTEIVSKITQFELYKKLWLGLAQISGVSVQGATYDHTKRIMFQNETREKAVLAAREKASTLARALGSEIGEPLLIEEELPVSEGWQRNVANKVVNNLRALDGDSSERADALSPGTIPIMMRVKAAFRLVTKKKG